MPRNEYAVKVGDLQWVRIPPGQLVARPEATRAAQEVTNVLKYSGVTGHFSRLEKFPVLEFVVERAA